MPVYFFDVHDGVSTSDDVGIKLADVDAAHAEALGVLSDLARHFPRNSALKDYRVIVRAEDGKPVLEAMLRIRCTVPGKT